MILALISLAADSEFVSYHNLLQIKIYPKTITKINIIICGDIIIIFKDYFLASLFFSYQALPALNPFKKKIHLTFDGASWNHHLSCDIVYVISLGDTEYGKTFVYGELITAPNSPGFYIFFNGTNSSLS